MANPSTPTVSVSFSTTIRHQAKPITEASLSKSVLLAVSESPVAEDYKTLVNELVEKEFK